jgi:molecular chaperone GrpE
MSKKKATSTSKWEKISTEDEDVTEEGTSPVDEATAPGEPEEQAGIDFATRDKLENQLTAMEQQAEKDKSEVLRAQADLVNVQRRAERDVSNARKFGAERLIVDMLPIVDSLVRGLEGPDVEDPQIKSMREGMSLTLDLINKTLTNHGVTIIGPAKGDVFNPELHEAMGMQQDPDAASNTILQVLQKGYSLNGRVLRAAMVMVAS